MMERRRGGIPMRLSPSDSSISSRETVSPSRSSSSLRFDSLSPEIHVGHAMRSLGSELGSHWGDEEGESDFELEYSDEDVEEDEFDDEHDSQSTPTASVATSTPVRYRRRIFSDELIERGSLRRMPPDHEAYEQLSEAVSHFPVVWEDENLPSPPTPSHSLLKALPWTRESEKEFMGEEDYPEDVSFGVIQIESKEAIEEREENERDEEKRGEWGVVRRRRYGKSKGKGKGKARASSGKEDSYANRAVSRRGMALRRMGLDLEVEQRSEYSDNESYSDDARSDMSSNYDYLSPGDYTNRGADYHPMTLRARYHPRMLVSRATDKAIQHVVSFATYMRFFVILSFALIYALWQ